MKPVPIAGEVYDLGSELASDYWKVEAVTGTARHSVMLVRCGHYRTRKRIGLQDFQRRAPRRSPR